MDQKQISGGRKTTSDPSDEIRSKMSHDVGLAAWLRSRGGYVHPDLDLFATLPNGDRGVAMTKAIAEGTNLIVLPLHCTMHIPSAKEAEERSEEGICP